MTKFPVGSTFTLLISLIQISGGFNCSRMSHFDLSYSVEVLQRKLIRKAYSAILSVIIPDKSLRSSCFFVRDHFHSELNMRLKVPIYISKLEEKTKEDVLESTYNLVADIRKHFTLVLVWSTSPEYFQFLEDHIVNPIALIDSQYTMKTPHLQWNRCFQIHSYLIPTWNWVDVDKKLKSFESLILDHYKRGYYKLTEGRRDNFLTRHMIVVSLILSHLNVSASACPAPLEKDFEADVEFAVNTIEDFNELSMSTELLYSHETFIVRFAAAYLKSGSRGKSSLSRLSILVALIGFNVFVATNVTFVVMIALLWLLSKVNESGISFGSVFSVVLRPIVDQCEERRLPSVKAYFRLILITWLFYCLLITDTYRGELISHMMKGQDKVWMKEFKDIADHKYNIANIGNRPGLFPRFEDILKSETLNSVGAERKEKFTKIVAKINKTQEFFGQLGDGYVDFLLKSIAQGKMLVIGDSFIMESFSDATEFLLGSRFYELSEEYVPNKIFWSVKRSPAQQSILLMLKRLRDSGVLHLFRAQEDLINHATINTQFKIIFEDVLLSESGVITGGKRGRVETLKLEHVRGVLAILFLGTIASVLLVLIEKALNSFHRTPVNLIVQQNEPTQN